MEINNTNRLNLRDLNNKVLKKRFNNKPKYKYLIILKNINKLHNNNNKF